MQLLPWVQLYTAAAVRHLPACDAQFAGAAAAAGKPWAGDAVAALVLGGLGCLRLARAEAAAQQAPAVDAPSSTSPDPRKPHNTRRQGASILLGASQSLTPLVARTLASKGLARTLLQVRSPVLNDALQGSRL
jgi:hypothetical protein